MAYVSTSSDLFRLIKRELYGYVEYKAQVAKETNKEFTKPIFGDGAIQVLIEVLKKRVAGENVEVPTVTGKVNYTLKFFFQNFLDDVLGDPEAFVRTPITLKRHERAAFLKDVQAMMGVSPERRQALLDVIRSLLPKVEGLRMRSGLTKALENEESASKFIEFTDVADAEGVDGE